MIHVIATVRLHPGQRERFLEEFHALVPHVLAEVGCLEYGPTLDLATGIAAQVPIRDDVVTILEKWVTLDHLKAHLDAPHMREYRPKVKDMVVSITLHILRPA